MIVQLPSNGLFGLTQTSLRVPKVGNLRDMAQASYTNEQAKSEFVRMLLEHPEDLERMSLCDRDYLFIIAASAVCLNNIQVNYTCPFCSTAEKPVHNTGAYRVSDHEPVFLEKGISDKVVKRWGDFDLECTYRILRASEESPLVEYALDDYDAYTARYEHAYVAATLGLPCSTSMEVAESVKVLDEYPVYVYFSALLFSQMSFHGVPEFAMCTCPACGKAVKVMVPFGAAVMQMDSAKVMNRFSALTGIMDFRSFLDLSMPELEQLEANIRRSV